MSFEYHVSFINCEFGKQRGRPVGLVCRFLCALKPEWRQDWARTWASLIRPGGELVTLIFPVVPDKPRDEGPPFPVTVDLYTELLTPLGTLLSSLHYAVSHPVLVFRPQWSGAQLAGRHAHQQGVRGVGLCRL